MTEQQDESKLISLLEDATDFAVYRVAVDPDDPLGGRVMMVSPSLKEIAGIADPWRFASWFENIHPDDLPQVIEANRRSWTEGVVYDQSVRVFHASKGEWAWVHTISTPIFGADGKLSHFIGLVQDITRQKQAQEDARQAHEELERRVIERTRDLELANEALHWEIEQRKHAEESLQISQALCLEVFDNSPLQLFVQEVLPGGHFRVLRTNPAHDASSGMQPGEIWGKTVEELVFPEVAEAINRHYSECIAAGKAIEYEEEGPSPYWNPERVRTFRTTVAPVFDPNGEVVRLIGASQDITEQKQAERILMERAREAAVSAERGRLARELHDAVTQTLFSTALTAEVLPKIWERSPAEGRKKLEELRELTRGALAEMRTLLMELRPDALADAELQDLLRHLINAFIARARIPARLSIEGCGGLPLDVKIAFYRVAQEALNNIVKHSEAESVTMTLTCLPEQTTLFVQDDGIGFDPQAVGGADHYGLRIMRERAEQVGACLEIFSQPQQGVQVTMRWQKTEGKEE